MKMMTLQNSKTELDRAEEKSIVEPTNTIWHKLVLFKEEVMGE